MQCQAAAAASDRHSGCKFVSSVVSVRLTRYIGPGRQVFVSVRNLPRLLLLPPEDGRDGCAVASEEKRPQLR